MSNGSFRIHNPSASPASSAPASSAPGSPSSSSSTNSTSSFNASRPAAAFRVPHAPNRPSPLAAAAQSSGRRFVSYQGNSDSEDDEPAGGARMVSNGDRDNVDRVDQEVELGWVLDAKGKGTYTTPQVKSQEIIIPSLANKDWRNSSRAASSRVATTIATKTRKTEIYLPPGAKTDPNAGPIITREITGDGPEEGGLIRHVRLATSTVAISADSNPDESPTGEGSVETKEKVELTLEERALRAVLASAGGQGSDDGEELDAIPKQEDQRQNTITEEEAFRRDVETRPDESSLDDYARVPVASFGLALLKGMGWKEGQAASRTRPGMVEAYVPKSRPSLLGIGAKERDAPTLAKGEKPKKPWKVKEEARKYSPIVRVSSSKESSVSRSPNPDSRRPSRSPSPSRRRKEGDRSREYARESALTSNSRRKRSRSRSRSPDRSSRRREDRDRSRSPPRRREEGRSYSSRNETESRDYDDRRNRYRDSRPDYERDRDSRRDDRREKDWDRRRH